MQFPPSPKEESLRTLQETLGYLFHNPLLLECALYRCGSELLRTSAPPTVASLPSLPMRADTAYIRVDDQLYYVCQSDHTCQLIATTPQQLSDFDKIRAAGNVPIKLNQAQLDKIASIIHHSPRKTPTPRHPVGQPYTFETLEFLGDRVLNLAITEELIRLHPDWTPGQLADEYVRYTRNTDDDAPHGAALYCIAKEFRLLPDLTLEEPIDHHGKRGKTRDTRRKTKEWKLSDHLEAVVGAMYLDSGNDSKTLSPIIRPDSTEQAITTQMCKKNSNLLLSGYDDLVLHKSEMIDLYEVQAILKQYLKKLPDVF